MGQIIANIFKYHSIFFLILILLFLPFATVIQNVESTIFTSVPVIIESSVDPIKAKPGDLLTVSITAFDVFGINRVDACFYHELGFDLLNLTLVSGTNNYGIWQCQWVVHDTKVKEYAVVVTVFSRSGFSSSVNLSWYDPAPWFNIDWRYRKELNISNPVSDYQMKLEIGYNSGASSYDVHCEGHCNTNFSDLRFTAADGTTPRSYWIERKTDGDNCLVWINTSGDNLLYASLYFLKKSEV